MAKPKISEEIEEQIKAMLAEGKSQKAIQDTLGISNSPIRRIIEQGNRVTTLPPESKPFTDRQIKQWDYLHKRYRRKSNHANKEKD